MKWILQSSQNEWLYFKTEDHKKSYTISLYAFSVSLSRQEIITAVLGLLNGDIALNRTEGAKEEHPRWVENAVTELRRSHYASSNPELEEIIMKHAPKEVVYLYPEDAMKREKIKLLEREIEFQMNRANNAETAARSLRETTNAMRDRLEISESVPKATESEGDLKPDWVASAANQLIAAGWYSHLNKKDIENIIRKHAPTLRMLEDKNGDLVSRCENQRQLIEHLHKKLDERQEVLYLYPHKPKMDQLEKDLAASNHCYNLEVERSIEAHKRIKLLEEENGELRRDLDNQKLCTSNLRNQCCALYTKIEEAKSALHKEFK